MKNIFKFKNENKDFKVFSNEYHGEEKEIFVLTNDESGVASKLNDSWNASQYFLAYIDLKTNELKNGEGRINWLLTDKECEKHGIIYPYYFKGGTIYHLKVRELIYKNIPEGRLPSFYNRFMVVKVLKEDIQNEVLQEILKEYRKPVIIIDEKLGKFELNKDYGSFNGNVNWLGKNISVSLNVDIDNKKSWTKALKTVQVLHDQQEEFNLEFVKFYGEKLTDLANDWLEDGNEKITKNDFINRISLSEIIVDFKGNYNAFYDDGDMFDGHTIDVSGNIKTGINSANITG